MDKLIHGCTNSARKRKLMTKGKTVTVKACLDLLRQYDAVAVTMQHLSNEQPQISATYSLDPTKKSQRQGEKRQSNSRQSNSKPQESRRQETGSRRQNEDKRCLWCDGGTHRRDDCPAKECLTVLVVFNVL